MKKYIYFHIFCINNWKDIVGHIFQSIFDSGLYDEVAEIRCCVLGSKEYWNDAIFADRKIRAIYRSEDISLREVITLNLLLDDSKKEDFHVLYLHSKGVSQPSNSHIRNWMDYMLYFNVHLYKIASDNLKYNDTCGVNYQGDYYSGNFWWSKSSHIRKLRKLAPAEQENYITPETWLTSYDPGQTPGEQCKVVNLWHSGVTHNRNPYPASNYEHALGRYDSRLKRLLKEFDCVLINNYKCGFSSSNLLETQKVLRISDNDRVILFYRNIFLRTVSTFINWCITDDRYKHEAGWLIANIKNSLPEPEYNYFVRLLSKYNFEETFRIYVGILEEIHQKNDHTLPQVRLVEHYNIEKIDHFLELENNDEFERITGIAFPYDRTNKSNDMIKSTIQQLLKSDDKLKDKIRHVYQKDINYFEGRGLSVDEI